MRWEEGIVKRASGILRHSHSPYLLQADYDIRTVRRCWDVEF
jgi:hypothetical protein